MKEKEVARENEEEEEGKRFCDILTDKLTDTVLYEKQRIPPTSPPHRLPPSATGGLGSI